MNDIVIRCPNKTHKKPIIKLIDNELVERVPNPKILFVASADSIGRFKVQCSDTQCRKSSNSRGWYEVTLNGCGGYTVNQLPPQRFNFTEVPYALSECTT